MLYNHKTVENYPEMLQLLDKPLKEYKEANLGSVYGRLARAYRSGKGVESSNKSARLYYKKAVSLRSSWKNEYIEFLEILLKSSKDDEKIELHIELSGMGKE